MAISNKSLLSSFLLIVVTLSSLLTTTTSRTTPLSHAVESPTNSLSPFQETHHDDSSPSPSPSPIDDDHDNNDVSSLSPSPSDGYGYDHQSPSPSPSLKLSTKLERMMQESMVEGSSSPTTNDHTALVKDLCSRAENPDKCGQYFQYSKSNDAAQIVHTEINTLKTLVEEGKTTATKVKQQQHESAEVTQSLDVCVESYDKANKNLDKASMTSTKCIGAEKKEECSAVEVGEVKAMLSATIANIGECEEAFEGKGLPRPPMKATNEAVVELSDWLLEFSRKLEE
ncbi:hypothetical protein LINGRAHAP2_LOCUS7397 [Linum grandiflorum]